MRSLEPAFDPVLRPTHTVKGVLAYVGRGAIDLLSGIGAAAQLASEVLRALLRDRQRWEVMVQQLYSIGYLSLPIVLVTGISMGLVMAVQAHATLVKFHAEVMSGPMVMYSLVTQIGPSMTALLVAGRAGSNIAAEIGTMKVTERIDALRVMGTNPVAYLVMPRVVALTVLMPLLGALAGFVGTFAGGFLLVTVWNVDAGAYWHQTERFVASWDVLMGIAKCPVLGFCMGIIACRQGLLTKGGASGVGESCTKAVVQACMCVLVLNFILTLLSNKLYFLLFR
jgi:phospholipid/cholesterol/gamma-HCH transport system permease protein